VLREYAAKEPRMRVVTQPNSGLIEVRKRGVAEARGDLVAFVDGDDYVHPEYLATLYDTMIKGRADIAVCGFTLVDENSAKIYSVKPANGRLGPHDALGLLIYGDYNKTGLYPMWNKLFKKSLFEGVVFPGRDFNLGEDQYLNLQLVQHVEYIAFTDEERYYYVQRGGSIMKSMKLSYLESYFRLWGLKKECIDKYELIQSNKKEIFSAYFTAMFDLYGAVKASGKQECIEFMEEKLDLDDFFIPVNLPFEAMYLARYIKYFVRRHVL